jgi:hypothetical protein
MPLTVLSRDTFTLPNGLLPAFKRHARVDFCDDDDLLQDLLARAIERFEIKTEIAVFPAQYRWTPDEWTNGRVKIPRPPVGAWTADADNPGLPPPDRIDVTSSYAIETDGWGGEVASHWLVGTWQTELMVTITTGFVASPPVPPAIGNVIPPGIRDVVFRIAGHLFEYREIFLPNNINAQAGWMDDFLVGYWQARA